VPRPFRRGRKLALLRTIGQKVHADDALPLGDRNVLWGVYREKADVVHHDVNGAELGESDVACGVESTWFVTSSRVPTFAAPPWVASSAKAAASRRCERGAHSRNRLL
jgi:hypothetical protein